MAGSMVIRWTSAARVAGLGLAAIAALILLAGALEPPVPPPLPPDVGLGPSASVPVAPSLAGTERAGVKPTARRPPRPRRTEPHEGRKRRTDPPAPEPRQDPKPRASVALPSAPPPPPGALPPDPLAPAPPPQVPPRAADSSAGSGANPSSPGEFGFER